MSAARLKRRKRRNGLAAFRAVELEVEAALVAGRTVLSIYDDNRERLAMSYVQFTRYVRRLRHGIGFAPFASRNLRSLRKPLVVGTGPPKGRPEDAVPTVNLDRFAAQALTNKDLF